MSHKWKADELVSFRSENVERFKRTFLRQAVCEFRFPTLMELGGPKPPPSFIGDLRKEFPTYELQNEVALKFGEKSEVGTHYAHVLRSQKLNWAISLKPSAISLETTSYTGFDRFRERVTQVVGVAKKVIDSDFFTRVGLRYINVIDVGDDPAKGWINEQLSAPLTSGLFSNVNDFSGRLLMQVEDGGCLLQHSLRLREPTGSAPTPLPDYVIDIDTFRNEVPIADALTAIDAMHKQAFDLFDWALGDKARDYLSAEKKS